MDSPELRSDTLALSFVTPSYAGQGVRISFFIVIHKGRTNVFLERKIYNGRNKVMVMFGSMVENNKSDGERYSAFSCLFLPLPPDSIAQDCFFAYPPEGHQLLRYVVHNITIVTLK